MKPRHNRLPLVLLNDREGNKLWVGVRMEKYMTTVKGLEGEQWL